MNCKQCGKEFQPTVCDACGVTLNPDTCAACGGVPAACPVCGRAMQPQQPPMQQAAPAPPAPQAAAPTAPAYPAPEAAPYPPQGGPGAMPPPPQPYQTAPGAMPPPPYGMPPQMPGGFSPYGGPLPTRKVALGGWLMVFLVLNCIGLAYSAYGLVGTLTSSSFSFLYLGIMLVFSVLPGAMILFYIIQRDIKFKYWFYFSAISTFLGSAIIILGVVGLRSLMSSNADLLEQAFASAGIFMPLSSGFLDALSAILVVAVVLASAVQVAWWVYFNKSRRVAYTFDPRNNPPK